MRNRIILLSVILVFMTVFIVKSGTTQQPQVPKVDPKWQKLYLAGCGLGGGAYMLAQGAAAVLKAKLGIDGVVEATGCGVDNLKLVERMDVHLSNHGITEPYRAVRGLPPYDKKYVNVRGMYPYYVVGSTVVVLKDSPIKTLEDLKGKNVSVHTKGSGSEQIAKLWLDSVGLTYDVIKPHFLTYGAGADALKSKSIDAVIWTTGIPVPQMYELGATHQYRIIEVPEKLIKEKVVPILPVFNPHFLAAEEIYGKGRGYVGPPKLWIVSTYTVGTVHKDLPDQLVYDMTKVIWENRQLLCKWHPTPAEMSYEMVRVMDASLTTHPGAKKFYEEAGVWTDNPKPVVRPLK